VRTHPAFAELEHSLDLVRDHIFFLALAQARDLARDITVTLDRDLDLTRAVDLALDRDRFRNPYRNRALARELVRTLDSARDRAQARTHALDSAVVGALDRDLDSARDRRATTSFGLTRDLGTILAELDGVVADLNGALHDFITADLRDVDLTGVQLAGLLWSRATTRWPADWEAQIELDSVEVAPDVLEVRGGSEYDREHASMRV
jgi:hypothetical protein